MKTDTQVITNLDRHYITSPIHVSRAKDTKSIMLMSDRKPKFIQCDKCSCQSVSEFTHKEHLKFNHTGHFPRAVKIKVVNKRLDNSRVFWLGYSLLVHLETGIGLGIMLNLITKGL